MPTGIAENRYDDSGHVAIRNLVDQWLDSPSAITADSMQGWSSSQKVIFLEYFLEKQEKLETETPPKRLHPLLVSAMGRMYGFTSTHNSEIRFRWQKLCLRCGIESIVPDTLHFLAEQGRMKFGTFAVHSRSINLSRPSPSVYLSVSVYLSLSCLSLSFSPL